MCRCPPQCCLAKLVDIIHIDNRPGLCSLQWSLQSRHSCQAGGSGGDHPCNARCCEEICQPSDIPWLVFSDHRKSGCIVLGPCSLLNVQVQAQLCCLVPARFISESTMVVLLPCTDNGYTSPHRYGQTKRGGLCRGHTQIICKLVLLHGGGQSTLFFEDQEEITPLHAGQPRIRQ